MENALSMSPGARGLAYTKTEEEDVIRRIESHHQNVIAVVGFLGSLVFAGLVLVVENPSFLLNPQSFETSSSWSVAARQEYFLSLVFVLMTVSALCIITCFVSMMALVFRFRSLRGKRTMYSVTYWATGVCFLGFVGSLYLVTAPINGAVALFATGVSVVFFVVLVIFSSWAAGRR